MALHRSQLEADGAGAENTMLDGSNSTATTPVGAAAERVKELSRLSKEEWREYTLTVWQIPNVVNRDHPAVFPEEIPHRLIKLFTFWGETVLDPFGGVGSTAAAALKLGRSAISIDQNAAYTELARQRCKALIMPSTELQCYVGDSRHLDRINDESVGLVVTSPPYWNKADYGEDPTNLGNTEGYFEFIQALRPTFEECFRVLKPGRKLCLVTANVSQHTDQGLLSFPLATDLTVLLRNVGFNLINQVIWNKNGTGGRWGSANGQRPIFGSYPYPPNFLFKTVHEYILVMAKPPAAETRGPKVRRIKDLMREPTQTATARVSNGAKSKGKLSTPNGKE